MEAYIVVYSITDLSSFQSAVHLVHSLVRRDGPPFGVILVANKSDLVRKRKVSADGNDARVVPTDFCEVAVFAVL